MTQTTQISKHLKEVFFGGNWTSVNLKTTLTNVSWEQATKKLHSLNTIAALVFHINYYVHTILQVVKGGPLDAHDKYSFDLPPINNQEEWNQLLEKMWRDAEQLTELIAPLPDSTLQEIFSEEKYGNYYRNFHGLIEHTHYHLGQIVVIRKLLDQSNKSNS